MKKLFVVLILAPVLAGCPVSFSSTKVEEAVRTTLGIPEPIPIQTTDMLQLDSLTIPCDPNDTDTLNLQGLQYATNLEFLNMELCIKLRDISALNAPAKLEEVHFQCSTPGNGNYSALSNDVNMRVFTALDNDELPHDYGFGTMNDVAFMSGWNNPCVILISHQTGLNSLSPLLATNWDPAECSSGNILIVLREVPDLESNPDVCNDQIPALRAKGYTVDEDFCP